MPQEKDNIMNISQKISLKTNAMNVSFPIPQELEHYVKLQVQSGNHASVADYFLALLHRDCQKKITQEKLKELIQEGLNSEAESVTPDYWQNLQMSVLETPPEK